jgi:hypothetical protein
VQLLSVPTDLVGVAWPRVAGLIAASARRSPVFVSPLELHDLCAAGKARLLLAEVDGAIAAAGIVSVGPVAGRTVCEILACAGTGMRSWLAGMADVEAWARFHGATSLRFAGRPGWSRVLPGYRVTADALFTKDL